MCFSMAGFNGDSGRTLYFHSLAGITENAVSTSLLDNSTLWEANPESSPRSFIELGNRGTQASSMAMDSNGNLFFGLTTPIAVACWDSNAPYSRDNMRIVAQNDQTLQFSSGLKVVRNKRGKEELWVLSCRFQVGCLMIIRIYKLAYVCSRIIFAYRKSWREPSIHKK